ncbi:hypothetical protein V6N12_062029 [Hibiscus sabdariffa]|uniref:SWIM-type domain-containing protein n=1 Tax=Hibiscus sabdariffa TaxID=183260 RepID=A0ABR2DYS1_9ROSI
MVDDSKIVYVLCYFHGGIFRTSPKFEYKNGTVERFQVDPDKLCLWDLIDNVKLLGYGHHPFIYYRVPRVEFNCDGLVLIHNDDTVRQVISLLIENGSVDIYVDHKIDVGDDCQTNNEVVEGSKNRASEDSKDGESEDGVDVVGEELGVDILGLEVAGENLRVVIEGLHTDCERVTTDSNDEIVHGVNDAREDLGIEIDANSNTELKEDNGQHCFLYDVELLSDVDDEVVSIRRKLIGNEKNGNDYMSERVGLDVSDEEYMQEIEVRDDALEEHEIKGRNEKFNGHESDYLDSSDPGEYGDSGESDEEICGAYSGKKSMGPRYDSKCAIPTWEVGMRFEDNVQFKEAVKKYSVAKGVKLKFVKNEPKRTRVHCGETCPWKLYASYDNRYDCFVVKTYHSVHMCFRNNKNTMLSCKMIQKAFMDRILMDPKMKVSTLKEMCQTELGAYAPYNMCQRARRAVLKEMQGSYVEEFANLWGYAAELLHSNPGSTVTIQKLMVDLNHPNGEGLTLMSDMQKGLIPVLRESFPDVDHRMCARHIYASWHKKWKGMNRKIQFWNTVRASFVEDFDEQLQKLEALGTNSSNDLLETPVECWSKAYFKGTSKCDVVNNNMAEAFNGWIIEARCKPIIIMLEEIRTMVMSRMNVKRAWEGTWRTNIAPRALQKLERNMENSTHCRLVWNGDGGFEVNHLGNQHTIDLKKLTCTCREWEINGIPCCHAICAMYHDSKKPETYISEWYSKDKYLASYNHILQPVRGKKFWSKGLSPILPPKVKVLPGRPKKNRRKDKDEPKKVNSGKYTRARIKITCSVCKATGHNKRKCPQTTNNDNSTQDNTNVNVGLISTPRPTSPSIRTARNSNTKTSTFKKDVIHRSKTLSVTSQEKNMVESSATNSINDRSFNKRKKVIGIGLYTDLQTGEQIMNPGMESERVVTAPAIVPKKIGAHTSQFQHRWKGPGLSWKGKKAVTTRQLQQENSDASRKHKIIKIQ